MLEDFEAGADLREAVGAEGVRIIGPAVPNQTIRIRDCRISGETTNHVSDVMEDLESNAIVTLG